MTSGGISEDRQVIPAELKNVFSFFDSNPAVASLKQRIKALQRPIEAHSPHSQVVLVNGGGPDQADAGAVTPLTNMLIDALDGEESENYCCH